ncbi:MAG: hypothetical protein ABIR70_15225 [Bryobacteraceae bacterium]
MNRFLHLSILAVALSGFASATVITMNSSATFTGGLDLAINGPDNNNTTTLTSALFGASSTFNLVSVGQTDWLALGTLGLAEGINDQDTAPTIIQSEYDGGYLLTISVDTNLGLLSFIAPDALFTRTFDSGPIDTETRDLAPEISVDFASLSKVITVGLTTYQLTIVDGNFSNNSTLLFNQNATAATVFLRAEVLRVQDENPSETPEVGTMAMLGSGLLGVGLVARRRTRNTPNLKFA